MMVEKFGNIKGIDISRDMISKIKNPKIDAMVGDVHKLEFINEVFDLIYMRNVIHYIDSPKMAFSEISRCLEPKGYFLFSQVVPPDDSISQEYDWLVGRDIHYPTRSEIIEWMHGYKILKKKEFVLTSQSIMNWLDNTCNDPIIKDEIITRHIKTSPKYKSLVNFSRISEDIVVDIKHFMILAQKV